MKSASSKGTTVGIERPQVLSRPCPLALPAPIPILPPPCSKAGPLLDPRLRLPYPMSGFAQLGLTAAGSAHQPWTLAGSAHQPWTAAGSAHQLWTAAGPAHQSWTAAGPAHQLQTAAGSAHPPWTSAGSAHPPWTAAAEGRGGPGGATLRGGRGSAVELRESCSEFLEFPSAVPRARSAGAPAPFLPPAFAAHQVPPRVPGRHGAAAGTQEVTNAGSGEQEGGGAVGAGRGPLGPTAPCLPPRLRRRQREGSECRAWSVPGARGLEVGVGGGAAPSRAGRAWLADRRWAAPAPPAGLLGAQSFPRGRFTKPGRRKTRTWLGLRQPCRFSCHMFFVELPFLRSVLFICSSRN